MAALMNWRRPTTSCRWVLRLVPEVVCRIRWHRPICVLASTQILGSAHWRLLMIFLIASGKRQDFPATFRLVSLLWLRISGARTTRYNAWADIARDVIVRFNKPLTIAHQNPSVRPSGLRGSE